VRELAALIFASRGDIDGARGRTAVALRHVVFEDLGLLALILKEAGWRTSYCDVSIEDLCDPSIASADLLIVLGGPIGVYDASAFPFLSEEVQLLERRLARGRPTLGICLGIVRLVDQSLLWNFAASLIAISFQWLSPASLPSRRALLY
jgi:hypothetical protein